MINTARRRAHLERMLRDRRREIQGEVRHGIRNGRMYRSTQGGDDIDRSDAHSQGDIELALVQMRAETLLRIDAALRRLAEGCYGSCAECAKEIRNLVYEHSRLRCDARPVKSNAKKGTDRSAGSRSDRAGPRSSRMWSVREDSIECSDDCTTWAQRALPLRFGPQVQTLLPREGRWPGQCRTGRSRG